MDIIKIDGYSCNDDVVLTICNECFGEYYKAFWDSYRFRYRFCGELGDGFLESACDVVKNVAQVYGLEFYLHPQKSIDNLIGFMKERLEKTRCLVLTMDVYYCPWSTDYYIRHNPHTLIVTAVQEDGVICADPGFKLTDVILPCKELESGDCQLIEPKIGCVSEKNEMTGKNKKRWNKKIIKAIKSNLNTRDMNHFYEELKRCSFAHEFGEETNIWYISLFVELSKVYSGHVRYAQFLREYQRLMGISHFQEVIEEIEALGSAWHMMYIWVMKMHKEYIQNEGVFTDYKAQMLETMQQVILREENVIKKLICVLSEKKRAKWGQVPVASVRKEHHIILPFNGKSHLCTGAEVEEGYEPEELFQIGREIQTSKCTFDMQPPDEEGNNVVFCSGEKIHVGETAKRICFLGYALWGNQTGAFTLFDKNGNEEVKRLFVSDWLEKEYPEEETVWSTTFAMKEKYGRQNRAKVVQFCMHFDEPTYVEEIQLPSEEKIQLFAMTVISDKF